MEKVIPVWHILSLFLHLPGIPNGQIEKPKRLFPNIATVIQTFRTALTVSFLSAFFVYEAVNLIFNRSDWAKYYANANKVISLLTLLRCTVASLKNCLTVIAFLTHQKRMEMFLSSIVALQASWPMSERRQKWHRFIGSLMCVPYVILFPVCTVFAVLFLLKIPAEKHRPIGIFQLDTTTAYILTISADLFGGIIACSIYLLIGMYARILKECCAVLNTRLQELGKKAEMDDAAFPYVSFHSELRDLRNVYEQIVDAYVQYEDAFSTQIVVGVVGNALLMFASVSSFFKPNSVKEWILAHATALMATFYSVITLCFHPICLNEESRKITQNLQTIIHRRQEARFILGKHEKEKVDGESHLEEYFSLFSFLQRSVTTPLAVSAGGFVELTRAFIVSLMAVLLGFVVFLLEQYEGHKPSAPSCLLPLSNRSEYADRMASNTSFSESNLTANIMAI